MERWGSDGLRILAQYEKRKSPQPADPEAPAYHESLRVDGQGLIPRAEPKYCVQINLKDDPKNYRLPLPPEFNRQKYFIIKSADLPVSIPFEADATISIIETDRRGEKVIAQSPVRYRTLG